MFKNIFTIVIVLVLAAFTQCFLTTGFGGYSGFNRGGFGGLRSFGGYNRGFGGFNRGFGGFNRGFGGYNRGFGGLGGFNRGFGGSRIY